MQRRGSQMDKEKWSLDTLAGEGLLLVVVLDN